VTGPKTNEGGTVAGERVGTRATAKYLRGSATKARQVLDLIRGLDVQRAEDVLRFTDREMGAVIRKVLASAVANAEHNDSQGRDELYVAACFADEGPTLRRFRPRARGRATRIRKRTCHITIVVARMSDEEARAMFQKLRWADNDGQAYCPKCGCLKVTSLATRPVWKCSGCKYQFSVTAGTIFADRKRPIRDYLLAIAIFANGAKGHSALQLSRDLHVSCPLKDLRIDNVGDDRLVFAREVLVELGYEVFSRHFRISHA
jgi:ribosomal protein L22